MRIPRILQTMLLASATIALSLPVVFAQGSGGQTTLEIYNADNNPVDVWLTLNNHTNDPQGNPGFVQNVVGLPWRHPVNMIPVPGNQFQGHFKLRNGDNAVLTLPVGQALGGNITFRDPPNNCPSTQNPNGQNLAEFTLNNNTPPFSPRFTQEAVDISCVNGVNTKMKFDLINAGAAGPWGTVGFPNVTTFANKKFGSFPNSNTNIPGVFPVGCDECVRDTNPGCPPKWEGWQGSSTNLCNVQRPANRSGGTVKITFSGFYPVPAVQNTSEEQPLTVSMLKD